MLEAIRTFLEKPRIAYLTTLNRRGYPHTVPVWFAVDGDDIITSGTRQRARFKHIQANPKGAITIGGIDSEGYLVQGVFTVEDDPAYRFFALIVARYSPGLPGETFLARVKAAGEKRVVFRLKPEKVTKVH